MEGEAAAQISRLRLRLSYLSTTITLAPLLGLLGTVLGMIKTFNVLSLSSGQPSIITGGVGEALIATAAGLCVAIIAALFHSYLVERLEDIITSLEIITNNFLEVLGVGK
ncbi:Protein TolQ [bioreactor metagenome]|uniref:Protein TolQ n=1 Tax=bioreactor metagenome TaxID=1076179 RepID=A0A645GYG1_9ZZZZ